MHWPLSASEACAAWLAVEPLDMRAGPDTALARVVTVFGTAVPHQAYCFAIRQARTKPVLDALHDWMVLTRQKVPEGSAIARALDYSLKRWGALTPFAEDGQLPIDNNWIENQIRPIVLGRSNWLFDSSLRAGQRAAAVMSLVQSARLNSHDPYAYLKDVLARLPMHRSHLIHELLPHRWTPA